MPTNKRQRPMQSYPMDKDLIVGLAKLAKIEHAPMAGLVRRAVRRELEQSGVIKPLGKIFGPTSRRFGRIRFKTIEEARQSLRPGDSVRITSTGGVVIERKLR